MTNPMSYLVTKITFELHLTLCHLMGAEIINHFILFFYKIPVDCQLEVFRQSNLAVKLNVNPSTLFKACTRSNRWTERTKFHKLGADANSRDVVASSSRYRPFHLIHGLRQTYLCPWHLFLSAVGCYGVCRWGLSMASSSTTPLRHYMAGRAFVISKFYYARMSHLWFTIPQSTPIYESMNTLIWVVYRVWHVSSTDSSPTYMVGHVFSHVFSLLLLFLISLITSLLGIYSARGTTPSSSPVNLSPRRSDPRANPSSSAKPLPSPRVPPFHDVPSAFSLMSSEVCGPPVSRQYPLSPAPQRPTSVRHYPTTVARRRHSRQATHLCPPLPGRCRAASALRRRMVISWLVKLFSFFTAKKIYFHY